MKEAILIWLIHREFAIVKSSYLETDFKQFLRSRYGKYASASTISRRWRELKGNDGLLCARKIGHNPEGEWILDCYGIDSWYEWTNKQRSLAHG